MKLVFSPLIWIALRGCSSTDSLSRPFPPCENISPQHVFRVKQPVESSTCFPPNRPARCIIHCVENFNQFGKKCPAISSWRCCYCRSFREDQSGPVFNPLQTALNMIFKAPSFPESKSNTAPPTFTFSLSSATLLTPSFKAPHFLLEPGIFSQRFHGYRWHSSVGSEPVSGNVTPSFRPMSLENY